MDYYCSKSFECVRILINKNIGGNIRVRGVINNSMLIYTRHYLKWVVIEHVNLKKGENIIALDSFGSERRGIIGANSCGIALLR